MVFRNIVRDSYRRIRAAIARINAYLRNTSPAWGWCSSSTASSAPSRTSKSQPPAHDRLQRRDLGLRALLPGGGNALQSIAIALVIWLGGHGVLRGTVTHRHAGGLHPVLPALLPAHPGPERQVQHPASQRWPPASASSSCSTRRRRSPRPTSPPSAAWSGPHRVRSRLVHLSQTGNAGRQPANSGKPHSNGTCRAESPSDCDWILRDVSFTIEPGQTVGHRGPHRRGQDHHHLPDDALLRRTARRDPHRRRRRARA